MHLALLAPNIFASNIGRAREPFSRSGADAAEERDSKLRVETRETRFRRITVTSNAHRSHARIIHARTARGRQRGRVRGVSRESRESRRRLRRWRPRARRELPDSRVDRRPPCIRLAGFPLSLSSRRNRQRAFDARRHFRTTAYIRGRRALREAAGLDEYTSCNLL